MIRVVKPGLFTTVQDRGRYGYAHLGISPAGAADALSLRIANLLVGNDENAPALEMTLLGATLEFDDRCGNRRLRSKLRVQAGRGAAYGEHGGRGGCRFGLTMWEYHRRSAVLSRSPGRIRRSVGHGQRFDGHSRAVRRSRRAEAASRGSAAGRQSERIASTTAAHERAGSIPSRRPNSRDARRTA